MQHHLREAKFLHFHFLPCVKTMHTVKSGRCSLLHKIIRIFHRSSNLFSTSSELVMEKTCDISEPNDGVDFSDRHASELHSDSKPFDQIQSLPKDPWYGQKYFECLVAHDLLLQTAAGEQISTISVSHHCFDTLPNIGCWKEPITDHMLCT